MCAEHDWLIAGAASYKFAFDKISENFVEIYIKILNFGRLLKNYSTETVYGLTVKKNFLGWWEDAYRHPPPPPWIRHCITYIPVNGANATTYVDC